MVLEREMSSIGSPAPVLPAALTMVPVVLQEPHLTLLQLVLFPAGNQGLWNVPGLCQTWSWMNFLPDLRQQPFCSRKPHVVVPEEPANINRTAPSRPSGPSPELRWDFLKLPKAPGRQDEGQKVPLAPGACGFSPLQQRRTRAGEGQVKGQPPVFNPAEEPFRI